MYNELVQRLREHNGWALNETLDQAADAIENISKAYEIMAEAYEAEVTKSYWIPVTERLPEKTGFYLCCYEAKNKGGVAVDEGLSIIQYLDGKWHLIDTYKVTHWIPIPEPPKGER